MAIVYHAEHLFCKLHSIFMRSLNVIFNPDALHNSNFIKKRLWHISFHVDFAKNIKSTFFYRTSPVAASEVYFSSHQKNIYCM